jgi:hypothetical protein
VNLDAVKFLVAPSLRVATFMIFGKQFLAIIAADQWHYRHAYSINPDTLLGMSVLSR